MAKRKTAAAPVEEPPVEEVVEPSIHSEDIGDGYVRLTVVPSGKLRDVRTKRTYRVAVCKEQSAKYFEVA